MEILSDELKNIDVKDAELFKEIKFYVSGEVHEKVQIHC